MCSLIRMCSLINEVSLYTCCRRHPEDADVRSWIECVRCRRGESLSLSLSVSGLVQGSLYQVIWEFFAGSQYFSDTFALEADVLLRDQVTQSEKYAFLFIFLFLVTHSEKYSFTATFRTTSPMSLSFENFGLLRLQSPKHVLTRLPRTPHSTVPLARCGDGMTPCGV